MAIFAIGDYEYTISGTSTNVSAKARDTTKSSYQDIPASVTYEGVTYSVTSVSYCFSGCKSLTQAPMIPNSVINMGSCFDNCTSLTQAPTIPNGVTNMWGCFSGCTSLIQAPVIPNSVTGMGFCFRGCTSLIGDIYVYCGTLSTLADCFYKTIRSITLHAMNDNIEVCDLLAATANNDNVYVNVHPTTPISFTDTQMNYMTDEGLKPLSLQTDASLVQCEIPDLVNGGTIITNVNDALIDLINRNKTPFVTYYFNDEDVINGIRFTWDYDNIIDSTLRLRGTSTGLDMVICKYTALFNGNYFIRAPRMGNDSSATYYRINNGTWRRLDVVTDVFSLASDDTVDVRLVVPSGNYISKQGQLAIFVSGGGA